MYFNIKYGLFKLINSDHYAVLGVNLDADSKAIRQRYLKIAQKLHPDACRNQSDREKQLASDLLSKLVNPAYKELSKDKSRTEYKLVLSQIGKRLVENNEQVLFTTEIAQELQNTTGDYQLSYKKLLASLASTQYEPLEQAIEKIIKISELNIAYLILEEKMGIGVNKKTPIVSSASIDPKDIPVVKVNRKTDNLSEEQIVASKLASYIRRAQEYIEKNNFNQAIVELRDAIKLEPNNSSCHALMGLAYLKQSQMTMAKVHINKAYQSNPRDPIAAQSKKELEKLESKGDRGKNAPKSDAKSTNRPAQNSGNSGILGGLFGGKKK